MKLLNKKGFALLDVVIGMVLLSTMVTMYYGGVKMYAKYTSRVNDSVYTNSALIECAEVVHSLRYGEIDKLGTTGWTSFKQTYPTGLYYMEYNDTTKVWDIKPIYKDDTTKEAYLSLGDMLETTGYTPATQGEVFEIGVKKNKMRRYIYINNELPEKASVKCQVKYYNPFYKRSFITDGQDIKNYETLKFIMTDYL